MCFIKLEVFFCNSSREFIDIFQPGRALLAADEHSDSGFVARFWATFLEV